MTLVYLLVLVPLLVIFYGGWPALTYWVLRFTPLTKSACLGIAFAVLIIFTLFDLRFTAMLPGTVGIPFTAEQKSIERIHWILIVVPYITLLLLLAFRYLKRRRNHDAT